ncbi:putative Acyl carrier protein [Vibrio owensii]|uniref:hypothetical protein n=1 Tax=Vibrio owensii TaxID=696485 RepID=UPI0028960E25|nr:putative Acyl carrier protein [Vibrio owensii]CAH1593271.1 putative Acyl carrier protein [Vibrio owensii]
MQDDIYLFIERFVLRVRHELKPEDVTAQCTIGELGLDSLDLSELHVELLDLYQFDFFRHETESIKCMTLQQLALLVSGQ